MKKVMLVLFIAICSCSLMFAYKECFSQVVICDGTISKSEIEETITESVDSQLEDLDFSSVEDVLNSLNNEQYELLGSSSFFDKVKKIINGEFSQNQQSLFSAILNLIFENILSFIPIICLIISIGITFSLVNASRPNSKNKSLGDVIHFVCFGAIIAILIGSITQMVTFTSNTIISIKKQIDAVMPILLTVMTAIGSNVSVSMYQPAVAVLSGTITSIFTKILMPIFIISMVFAIVSNLSNNVKLNKFTEFFSSLFKWIIGIVFTVFSAFLAIQGISAGNVDGISIRTAKYTIKNTIPLVGSYLADGLNLIVASSVLIKNAVGLCGLILLLITILVPVLKLIVYLLALKLTSAILEPVTDSKISNFITMISKNISLLIVLILGCAFSYMLVLGIVMCTANVF